MEQDPQQQPENIPVKTTKIQKGNVKIFANQFWKMATPATVALVTKAMRYFTVGIMTMVSGADVSIISNHAGKVINFCLGIFVFFLGGVDMAVGVEPIDKNKAAGILLIMLLFVYFK